MVWNFLQTSYLHTENYLCTERSFKFNQVSKHFLNVFVRKNKTIFDFQNVEIWDDQISEFCLKTLIKKIKKTADSEHSRVMIFATNFWTLQPKPQNFALFVVLICHIWAAALNVLFFRSSSRKKVTISRSFSSSVLKTNPTPPAKIRMTTHEPSKE